MIDTCQERASFAVTIRIYRGRPTAGAASDMRPFIRVFMPWMLLHGNAATNAGSIVLQPAL
jgi:hypothetical protein